MPKSTAAPGIKLNLRPAHLKAIGHVIAQWAFLETEVDFTIRALLAIVDDPDADKGLPKSFEQRIRLWKRLVNKGIPNVEIRNQIRRVITRAKVASQHRNVFAHARLSVRRSNRRTTIHIEAHRHIAAWRVEAVRVRPRALEDVARTIAAISHDLIAYNQAHLRISPASLPYRFGR